MPARKQAFPGEDRRQPGRPRLFGLRVKLIGLLLLLSLPLGAVFAEFFQRYLLERFDHARGEALARYERQINGLIRQQRMHLEQVAIALPALSDVRAELAQADLDDIERRFDRFWSAFQIDMGLTDALYFDARGQPLAHWGENGLVKTTELELETWSPMLKFAREREVPTSFIVCTDICRIHALAPALVNGRLTGLFAVGASLAETVLAFRETSSADIAVLARAGADDKGPLPEHWGLKIEALSNRSGNQPLLEQLALRGPLGELQRAPRLKRPDEGPQRIVLAGRTYEAAWLPLVGDNQTSGMRLLVVEDISNGLAEVERAAAASMQAIMGFTALSMLLIYVLLGRRLAHLLRTAHAIPLLGESAFAQLRQSVRPRRKARFPDEIDVLDQTAIALSHRLESLEAAVAERTRSLQAALREITLEKEFADGLLESAEVIIATSDRAGRLLSLNRYGLELTGYSASEVAGLPIVGSALLPNATVDLYGRLHELISGQVRHLRHESAMAEQAGGIGAREVSWVHTGLSGQGRGEAALLSVGLDISERRRGERHLSYLEQYDPLTDTLNRRGFQDRFERMLDMARRLDVQGALFYLDLDRFKLLNETSGHQVGDELLIKVGNALKSLAGQGTALTEIGRLGGDEFAIAALNVDHEGVPRLAAQIIQTLAAIPVAEAPNFRVAASVGIALFPEQGIGARELLVNADIAMYQAKAEKRGGWHVFSPEEKARERMHDWFAWEARIKEALANDHFVLFFQPVVRLSDNEISHYEVLIRLRNPDGSLMPPGQFLEVAERAGLIGELDRWVVRKSLEKLASMTGELAHIALAINLSGGSLSDPRLLDDLHGLLQACPVDPSRIIFEITETVAVADFNVARAFVDTLREWGCVIALDDFGSGFASFYYLKQFPVDCVKIDGAFIRNLPDNRDDQIFVRAMVDIARAYGKKTVAEFVENEAIVGLLEEYGVDYAQGYHIGKPGPQLLPV
jgi:diguanylate cyclase (GGDEF)-like protein/PAS domain S-box-containing protein